MESSACICYVRYWPWIMHRNEQARYSPPRWFLFLLNNRNLLVVRNERRRGRSKNSKQNNKLRYLFITFLKLCNDVPNWQFLCRNRRWNWALRVANSLPAWEEAFACRMWWNWRCFCRPAGKLYWAFPCRDRRAGLCKEPLRPRPSRIEGNCRPTIEPVRDLELFRLSAERCSNAWESMQ